MDNLAQLVLEIVQTMINNKSLEERRQLGEAIHRAIVVLDDYLCARFSFSRKPRGRYDRADKETN